MSSMPKKLNKNLTRRLLRKWLRRLSLRTRVLLLVAFGFVLGVFVEYILLVYIMPLFALRSANLPSVPTMRLSLNDRYVAPHRPSFTFFFATGRSGTQHLSRVFLSPDTPVTYVTHEEEHPTQRTKHVVQYDYRPLAASASEADFNLSALQYVTAMKIPFYNHLLQKHGARRLVYTGHVPLAFGLGPTLVNALPEGSLRIVRVRRDRISTAVSLMALGPELEDPWGATTNTNFTNNATSLTLSPPTVSTRWFPRPTDAFVRLNVSPQAWISLNRFQRWLWYVDDIECRWQALQYALGHRFSWMEESLENLSAMDGGRAWKRLAEFIGVKIDWNQVGMRDNSIQYKQRVKTEASESQLRAWDIEYRKLVGKCTISDSLSYGWQDFVLRKL
ncbi:unnamed protein product [Agarophyton chilense]